MGIYHIFVWGLYPSWFQRHLNSRILKRGSQLHTIMGLESNISLSGWFYWYATLKSCKYLKTKTHLRNAKINKAVDKGIVKACLILDMVRRNWSWIVESLLLILVFITSARFGSFWVAATFSTAEIFKYLFFTAMKIHTMTRIVRKQKTLFLVH